MSVRRDWSGLLLALLLLFVIAAGLLYTHIVVPAEMERVRIDAHNRGHAAGLAEGMASATSVPADPDRLCHIRLEQIEDELEAAATCEARLIDHQRTAAAGRESARLLGLNEGLRLGREDWRAQGFDCRDGLSDLALGMR